jgi:hypothetical protein
VQWLLAGQPTPKHINFPFLIQAAPAMKKNWRVRLLLLKQQQKFDERINYY